MDRLFTRLKDDLMTSVSDALADFRRAFDDRLKSVEETCKELAVHAEIQASARSAEIDHFSDRVCELEVTLARNKLAVILLFLELTRHFSLLRIQ